MPKYTADIGIEIESDNQTQARYDIEDIAADIMDRYPNVTNAEMAYWQVNEYTAEESLEEDPSGINDHSTFA